MQLSINILYPKCMKPFQEITSLYSKEPFKNTVIYNKYKLLNKYFYGSPKLYYQALTKDPPEHPLAKRFDKLVRYTARLIGNPNPQNVKKTLLKLLKRSILSRDSIEDDFHDLIHLAIGQSIEIFLRKKVYEPEHYIYEAIVATIERGIDAAALYLYEILPFAISRGVSLTKLYNTELKLLKTFFKTNPTYHDHTYKSIKSFFLLSSYFNIFHLYNFFSIYTINPAYPLAINFKNEILKELTPIANANIDRYKQKLQALIPELIQSAKKPQYIKRFLQTNFKPYNLDPDTIKNLITNMEIFPDNTKLVIKKFVTYLCAILDKYPLPNQ